MYINILLQVLTHCKYATNMPYRCNSAMIHKGLKMNSQSVSIWDGKQVFFVATPSSVVRCSNKVFRSVLKKSFTESMLRFVSGRARAYSSLSGQFAVLAVEIDAPRRGYNRKACVSLSQDYSGKALRFYRRAVFLTVFHRFHSGY